MQIFIKANNGTNHKCNVEPGDTAQRFYDTVRDKLGLSEEQASFVFGGRPVLGPHVPVGSLGLREGSVVHLVQKLLGGTEDRRLPTSAAELRRLGITTTSARDTLTWSEDPSDPRAVMSCGHAFTAQSVFE